MKKLRSVTPLLTLIFLVISNQVYAQPSTEKVKSYINKLIGNEQFEITDLSYSGGDESNASGTVKLFGAENVTVAVAYAGKDEPKTISLDFGTAATINLSRLNSMFGGSLIQHLPPGIPTQKGLSLRSVSGSFAGTTVTNIEGTFGLMENWTILESSQLVFDGITFSAKCANPTKKESRVFSGSFTGQLKLGGTSFALGANLSQNKQDFSITGSISNLSLQNLLDQIPESAETSVLTSSIPPTLKDFKIETAELTIFPTIKKLSTYINTSAGEVEMQMKGNGSAMQVTMGFATKGNFKFSDIHASLAAFDQLKIKKTALFITNRSQTQYQSRLTEFREKTNWKLAKGVSWTTSVELDPNLVKLTKIPTLELEGHVGLNFQNAKMQVALNDIDLGSPDVKMSKVAFGFEVGIGKMELFVIGALEVTLDKDQLMFMTELRGSPIDLDIQGSLLMQALGKVGQQPREGQEVYWEQPFGVPGVAIGRLGGMIGLSPKSPVVVSSLGVTGSLRMGTVTSTARHLTGQVDAVIDIANPSESLLAASVGNLTLGGAVDAFYEPGLSGSLKDALDTGFDSAYVYIVPKAREFMGRNFDQGLALGGTLKIAGFQASCDFAANLSGIKAAGTMDPIRYFNNGTELFAITNANNTAGPNFNLELNASDPKMALSGQTRVLGMTSTADVKLGTNGIKIEISGQVMGGALSGKAIVDAPSFAPFEGITVGFEANNQMQTMLKDALVEFIDSEHKKNAQSIRDAQNSVANAKSNNGAEQAFLDLAGEGLKAVGSLENAAAVAGKLIADGVLGQSLNIRKIYFNTGLDQIKATMDIKIDMTVMGEEINTSVSINLKMADVEAMLNEIAKQLEDEVMDVFGQIESGIGKELEQFATDAVAFVNDAGKEIEKVGNAAVKELENFGQSIGIDVGAKDRWRQLPSPSNGYNTSITPIGYHKFTATITEIKVVKCDESGSCDFYGAIAGSVNTGRFNKGSNYYFAKCERGGAQNSTIIGRGIARTIYVDGPQVPNALLSFNFDFTEDDDGFGDDHLKSNSHRIRLASALPNQSYSQAFTVVENDNGNGNKISFTVKIDHIAPPSDQELFAAARIGASEQLHNLIKRGGNAYTQGLMEASITGGNIRSVQVLQLYKIGISRANLSQAIRERQVEMTQHLLRTSPLNPTAEDLRVAVEGIHTRMIKVLMAEPIVVNDSHLKLALQKGNMENVKLLLQHPITASKSTCDLALQKNDAQLIDMLVKNHSHFTVEQLNACIDAKKETEAKKIAQLVPPNATSLMKAVETNKTDFFKAIADESPEHADLNMAKKAIDLKNASLLDAVLHYGAPPSDALKYAVAANSPVALISVCLDDNANPNYAVDYAFKSNDFNLVNRIIGMNADPNLVLEASINNNNESYALKALNNGASAIPHVANAANRKQWTIVKELVLRGGDATDGLSAAVQDNNLVMVQYLIDYGANTNQKGLVLTATKNKNANVLSSLLENGANPEEGMSQAVSYWGEKPELLQNLLNYGGDASPHLGVGIQKNDPKLVGLLLSYGADTKNHIKTAVAQNQTENTNLLLSYGADPSGQVNQAVQNKNLAMVQSLIEYGADPNEGFKTSLEQNNTEIATFLLKSGAIADGLLSIPSGKGNLILVKLICDAGVDPTEGLQASVSNLHEPVMNELLLRGASVLGLNLDAPARAAKMNMVKTLVESGALAQNGLLGAAQGGNLAMIQYLIDNGATAEDPKYISAAVKGNHGPSLVLFQNAGANIAYKDATGNSLMHYAADAGADNSVLALYKLGAPYDDKNNEGDTPLLVAVQEGKEHLETIMALVEAGADINATNAKGKSVRQKAKSRKVKKYLKEMGAQRKVKD